MNEKSQSGEYSGKCEAIISAYKRLDSIGLNRGSSGNISIKTSNGFLITPSGLNVEKIHADDRDSARKRQMALGDHTPTVLAILTMLAFFGYIGVPRSLSPMT